MSAVKLLAYHEAGYYWLCGYVVALCGTSMLCGYVVALCGTFMDVD